jgi:hypothetical protein
VCYVVNSAYEITDCPNQDIPNTYRVCGVKGLTKGLPSTVTFTSTDPRLPPPDPRYLRVHAACAKVAHLSGAGECIDKIIWDMEDTSVLAADGSSAEGSSSILNVILAVYLAMNSIMITRNSLLQCDVERTPISELRDPALT